jgi:hypothetical protein
MPFVHTCLSFAPSPTPIFDSLAYGHPCTRGTKRTLQVFVLSLLCTLVHQLLHHPYLSLALSWTRPTVWSPVHKRHEMNSSDVCFVPQSCPPPPFCLDARDPHNEHSRCSLCGPHAYAAATPCSPLPSPPTTLTRAMRHVPSLPPSCAPLMHDTRIHARFCLKTHQRIKVVVQYIHTMNTKTFYCYTKKMKDAK